MAVAPRDRSVRVFISSTFRDMQAEREELVKRVFPHLRKLCESRGVTWGEVDLRWGVTHEQAAEGQVLPICLAEIDRCRPYFIGILGDRYGWVPDKVPASLLGTEPWLDDYRGRSVTELEILHGVLRDPEAIDRAFFYFRAPGGEGSEDPSATEKLAALKQRIRESGAVVHEDFSNGEALGQLVLDDLGSMIDRDFPAGEVLDPVEQQAAEHDAFAESRRRVYVGGDRYREALDEHVAGEGPPLVVLGASGSGKTALLANWAHGLSVPVIEHYVGATGDSTELRATLWRVLSELQRMFGIEGEVPYEDQALRQAFGGWLTQAAARGRFVLVLDGLNQLEETGGLGWLPREPPANARIVLSTLPGPALDTLSERGWPTCTVEPLGPEDRSRLIRDYLAQYRKELGREHMSLLESSSQTSNPLFLRAILEELRLHGDHFTLEERIRHYLEVEDTDQLFGRILERYEEDFERHRPGLVRETLSLLWAARRGLSETELRQALGTHEDPLPQAVLSPLLLAAESSLVRRSGLLGFFHDYMRDAVERRFLPTVADRVAARVRVAEHFKEGYVTDRFVEEVPWQYARASEWDALQEVLLSPVVFTPAWTDRREEVLAYWAQIESHTGRDAVEAYAGMFDGARLGLTDAFAVAEFLEARGESETANGIFTSIEESCRQTGHLEGLAHILETRGRGVILYGKHRLSIQMFEEAAEIRRKLGDENALVRCLGALAISLRHVGDLQGSLERLREAEVYFRKANDHSGLLAVLTSQAKTHEAMGDFKAAGKLYAEAGELGAVLGQPEDLEAQAKILQLQGRLAEARLVLEKWVSQTRERGGGPALADALARLASMCADLERYEEAKGHALEALGIYREVGFYQGFGLMLLRLSEISRHLGDEDTSEAQLQKAEAHFEKHPDDYEGNQGCLFQRAKLQAPEDALATLERVIEAAEVQGDTYFIRRAYKLRAEIEGPPDDVERMKQNLKLRAVEGDQVQTEYARLDLAQAMRAAGKLKGALILCEISRDMMMKAKAGLGVAEALYVEAAVRRDQGQLLEARQAYRNGEVLLRKLLERVAPQQTATIAESLARTLIGLAEVSPQVRGFEDTAAEFARDAIDLVYAHGLDDLRPKLVALAEVLNTVPEVTEEEVAEPPPEPEPEVEPEVAEAPAEPQVEVPHPEPEPPKATGRWPAEILAEHREWAAKNPITGTGFWSTLVLALVALNVVVPFYAEINGLLAEVGAPALSQATYFLAAAVGALAVALLSELWMVVFHVPVAAWAVWRYTAFETTGVFHAHAILTICALLLVLARLSNRARARERKVMKETEEWDDERAWAYAVVTQEENASFGSIELAHELFLRIANRALEDPETRPSPIQVNAMEQVASFHSNRGAAHDLPPAEFWWDQFNRRCCYTVDGYASLIFEADTGDLEGRTVVMEFDAFRYQGGVIIAGVGKLDPESEDCFMGLKLLDPNHNADWHYLRVLEETRMWAIAPTEGSAPHFYPLDGTGFFESLKIARDHAENGGAVAGSPFESFHAHVTAYVAEHGIDAAWEHMRQEYGSGIQ